LRFPDGTRHHGKGDYSRAKQSAREHGYEVAEADIDWTSADSHREAFEAFKDEHERLEADGGKENEDNHNRINSPGGKNMKNRIVELKKRLQPENAAVLARFAADGVDISSEKEVAFFIEMPSKDDVFKCSSEMRCQFKRKAFHGSVTHTEPQKTVYYRYDIVLPMTADAISQIEAELLSVCEEHGGTRSFWEFAD
jgi:hypothetical protein